MKAKEKEVPTDIKALMGDILGKIKRVNFMVEAYPEVKEIWEKIKNCPSDEERKKLDAELKKYALNERQKYVIIVDKLIALAKAHNYGLCKHKAFGYIYNKTFWVPLEKDILMDFLGKVAEKMGLPHLNARQHAVRDQLLRQFFATGFLPAPTPSGEIKINLQNGTFVVKEGKGDLRGFDPADFLRYRLPFNYDKAATAPQFETFLDEVLPDKDCQKVLAEYLGWLFLTGFKLEKALILYGSGANGKSVVFDIISALLGRENISNYSAGNLCDDNGYYRAMLVNKLLNYSSEIGSGRTNVDTFKQLISGEPVPCRLPYGEPFILDSGYARLMFNANTLPKDTEQKFAYFRRFIILPFTVTIPEGKQDKFLAQKIIKSELSGIFNWVLQGLDRLISNNGFTESKVIRDAVKEYRQQSDTVQMFLADEGYEPSTKHFSLQKTLFAQYKSYCYENNYHPAGNKTFADRCRAVGYHTRRMSDGMAIGINKIILPVDQEDPKMPF